MESLVREELGEQEVISSSKHTGRRLFNSTSTMTVPDTLAEPNNELTIRAVAERLAGYIVAAAAVAPVPPLAENASAANTPAAPTAAKLPTADQVGKYIGQIFRTAQCSVDCTIVCLVYIERLLATSGLQLTTKNWRSLVAVGMLLASKVHDDLSMVNADFALFLPFKVEQINAWERQFLAGLKYDVRVSASLYTKLYFDLRERAHRSRRRRSHHQREEMDSEVAAQRVEHLSLQAQRRIQQQTSIATAATTATSTTPARHKPRRAVSDHYVPSPSMHHRAAVFVPVPAPAAIAASQQSTPLSSPLPSPPPPATRRPYQPV